MKKKEKKQKQQIKPINQRIFSYWQALYRSFYSPQLYKDVAKRWKGFGALYLLFLIALAAIPYSLRIVLDFNKNFEQKMILPLKELPPLTIQKGIISFDKPMPYFIKNNDGQTVAIIDTTGVINQIDNTYPDLTLLVTKDKLLIRPPQLVTFFKTDPPAESTIIAQPLNKSDNEVFSGKKWLQTSGILKLKYLPILLVYPIIVFFTFILYLLLFLIVAIMGQVFAKVFFDLKITYKQSCRIFAVSATPEILFFFLMITGNFLFTGLGLVYVAMLTVFYSYAIATIKHGSDKLVLT